MREKLIGVSFYIENLKSERERERAQLIAYVYAKERLSVLHKSYAKQFFTFFLATCPFLPPPPPPLALAAIVRNIVKFDETTPGLRMCERTMSTPLLFRYVETRDRQECWQGKEAYT